MITPTTAENIALGVLRVIADGHMSPRKARRLALEALRTIRDGYTAAIEPEDSLADGDPAQELDRLDRLAAALATIDPPVYRSPGDRALARVRHAVAVLAGELMAVRVCVCEPGRPCEPCVLIDRLTAAVGDAGEFLAAGDYREEE